MTLVNGSANNAIFFENDSWKTGALTHDVTNSSGTFTVLAAGRYAVHACVQLSNNPITSRAGIQVKVNGTPKTGDEDNLAASGGYPTVCVHDILNLAANDALTVNFVQNSVGTIATTANELGTYITIKKDDL